MSIRLRKLFSENAQRGLALILLASLSWAATVEVNHRHQIQGAARSATETPKTPNGSDSSIVDADSQTTSSRVPLTRGECSICQLHQNLFTSLFSHTLIAAPVLSQVLSRPAGEILYFSPSKSARYGRAPPINS